MQRCIVSRHVLWIGAVLGLMTMAACGRSSSTHEQSDPTAPRSDVPIEKDACALLEPKEVEAVLAASLATPPFLSRDGVPEADGDVCEYEDADLHNISIAVEWTMGAMAFKMRGLFQSAVDQTAAKGLVHLSEGADGAGEWDEARVVGCCTFVALRGDQMVTIDVGGSKAPMSAAASLADMALKRLDHLLAISGAPNVKRAIEFDAAHRPKKRNPCALVTRAEAEAIVGKLAEEPTPNDDRCVYQHVIEGPFGPTYVLKIRWIGGLSDFRLTNDVAATFAKGFTKSVPLSGDGKQTLGSSLVGDDLASNPAWDVAHFSIMGLSAVKKDVSVSIEPQGGGREETIKLMEKAMSKL